MLKIKTGMNLGEPRYEIYRCPVCGSVFAVRYEKEDEYIDAAWKRTAHEPIESCDICGETDLKLITGLTVKEYVETLRPVIGMFMDTRNIQSIMRELYIIKDE